MADQIFKVLDKKLGTIVLVSASSKRRAEKYLESGRFEATKATSEEITRAVNEGAKIMVEGPHVQSSGDVDPAQTATIIHNGRPLANPAEARAPLTEKAPEKNLESWPAGHELGFQPPVEGGDTPAVKATTVLQEQAAGVIASDAIEAGLVQNTSTPVKAKPDPGQDPTDPAPTPDPTV